MGFIRQRGTTRPPRNPRFAAFFGSVRSQPTRARVVRWRPALHLVGKTSCAARSEGRPTARGRKTLRSERPWRSGVLEAPAVPLARCRSSGRGYRDNPDRRGSGRQANGAAFFRAADRRLAKQDAFPTGEASHAASLEDRNASKLPHSASVRRRRRLLQILVVPRQIALEAIAHVAWPA